MIKKIIYLGVILAIIGACLGYYMFNQPLKGIEQLSTDFTLSPDDLLASFENDEDEANKIYLDKVIEVTGRVSKVTIENNKTSVHISTDNEMSNVIFQLENNDPLKKVGETITMKGICTGYLMDVVLVRATVINN